MRTNKLTRSLATIGATVALTAAGTVAFTATEVATAPEASAHSVNYCGPSGTSWNWRYIKVHTEYYDGFFRAKIITYVATDIFTGRSHYHQSICHW